ncbi:MAG TPA: hypothetical protein PKC18_04635 [Lacipirellulaceae bacterium]|nr:hypothetical protein [Lacipirellulaceae bacterium]HMP06979.1 hypothetical protein [Lacipirellulaceae bacterium]
MELTYTKPDGFLGYEVQEQAHRILSSGVVGCDFAGCVIDVEAPSDELAGYLRLAEQSVEASLDRA